MESLHAHQAVEPPSEKNFAWTFFAAFMALAVWLGYHQNLAGGVFAVLGVGVLTAGRVKPGWLVWPNKLWFHFGLRLNRFVSPVFLTLLYALTILPVGIILRLLGKDIMRLKFDPRVSSYWISRVDGGRSMKDQF